MSAKETYLLAHTARCKLQMAADRPDRNLRFILGHAFTLDKLMLRVVEIESESSSSDDDDAADQGGPTCGEPRPQRVSFRNNNASPHVTADARKRSPPPNPVGQLDGSDSDSSDEEYEDDVEEEEEDNGLSLRRFASAAAQPPRMVDDDSSEDEDEDEPKSPPPITDEELKSITEGADSEELAGLYQNVKRCPCHGQHGDAPVIAKAWDVPQKLGQSGNRLAVVQIVS